jgi:hypothetical protein
MKKVIRDGMVAILYSPGYGAGWSTWGGGPEMVFDPEIVELVEQNRHDEISDLVESRGLDFYCGGASDLRIMWLPEGTAFRITEYDGNESVEVIGEIDYLTA